MADGELTLNLDAETRRRLSQAADAAGVSVEAYALEIIAEGLEHDGLTVSRRRVAEYDRTGAYITVEQAMAHFDAELEGHRARRR